MDPMAMLALATVVFLATHYVASTPIRSLLVRGLGDNGYLGLHSLVSLVTLVWMIWAYAKTPFDRVWVGDEFKAWMLLLMPVSLVLVVCGLSIRNPTAVRQGNALKSMSEPHGILRVTRHPLMWGIAIWAFMHLVTRGDTASFIFFGGLLLLALSGSVMIDRRMDRNFGVDWMRFAAKTSNVPFAAIVQGRNQFKFEEIGWSRVVAGLALYVVLMALHPYVIGTRAY
jgi:uncharacterized membrane protein